MAGVIVGRRMRGWKRSRWQYHAGVMRFFCWFEIEHHDLHSTKGWRLVKRFKMAVGERDPRWRRAPAYQEHFIKRATNFTDEMRRVPYQPPEASLLKHDWYRRQKFGRSRRLTEEDHADL